MTPEERRAPGAQQGVPPTRLPDRTAAPDSGNTDPETLRLQIRQTRGELGSTIDEIERQLGTERLAARAEQLADHVVQEATERARQVALDATDHAKSAAMEAASEIADHAKDAAKDITDHALAETKQAIREMAGQASAAAREATIGKVENMVQNASRRAGGAGSGIVDLISRNPMAAALAGIGLGWMLLGNRQESSSIPATGRYYPASGRYAGPAAWTSSGSQPMGEQLSGLGEKVGEKLGEAQTAARGAIDQVQETAGTMAGQAQDMAQSFGGNAADAGSSLLDTIQRNPVPAAIAAASLSYLLFNRPGSQTPATVYEARYRASEAAGQLRDSTGQLAEDAQGAAGEVVGRVQQATGRVVDQAQGAIGGVGGSLQTQALRTQYRFEQFFSDHPLVVGAAALALGMVVGLPVPQTQQEHELMGQVSGKVIDRAQSVAQETAQKLQQAVEQQGPDEELRRRAREVAAEAEQLADRLNKPA